MTNADKNIPKNFTKDGKAGANKKTRIRNSEPGLILHRLAEREGFEPSLHVSI